LRPALHAMVPRLGIALILSAMLSANVVGTNASQTISERNITPLEFNEIVRSKVKFDNGQWIVVSSFVDMQIERFPDDDEGTKRDLDSLVEYRVNRNSNGAFCVGQTPLDATMVNQVTKEDTSSCAIESLEFDGTKARFVTSCPKTSKRIAGRFVSTAYYHNDSIVLSSEIHWENNYTDQPRKVVGKMQASIVRVGECQQDSDNSK
jgi:Protein of unknown function (DUF3617)